MSSELYSRQTTLNLKRYKSAIVVGLGGIGNWVALDLALSGKVDILYLIDPDKVEESNMNRTIFRYCDIGSYKVDAVKYQIMERRSSSNIIVYKELTNQKLLTDIFTQISNDISIYNSDCLIMDCRDDIYDDLYDFNCKLYKIGYDGTSITIDGNPRLTKVWTQRGGSYRVIPSYIGSSQIAAAIVVNDALCTEINSEVNSTFVTDMPFIRKFCTDNGRDECGRLNCCVTFDCKNIIQNCSNGSVRDYNKDEVIKILQEERDLENQQ